MKRDETRIMPGYAEIRRLSEGFDLIPVRREIYADITTPIALLRRISGSSDRHFLLESVEGGEKWGRYSFLGFDPIARVFCRDGVITIEDGGKRTLHSRKPLGILREYLSGFKAPKLPGMPPFAGGFVGYFSYSMAGYAEPVLKLRSSEFNDFDLMLFDKVIAYDHLKQKIIIIANMRTDKPEENYAKALDDIEGIVRLIRDQSPLPGSGEKSTAHFSCNVSREEFCDMVRKVKKYIKEGDVFQVVISRRYESGYSGSLLDAYRVLRTTNPSPYMVFLQNQDVQLISTSPETLVRLQDGKLTTLPIAGTMPRGRNAEEDLAFEKKLVNDEKELAEHDMLVDLARNDLGKVSEYSSIRVNCYRTVKRYSRVMHITSEVEGRIRRDRDALDAIEALLPAGTLSGAPKIRACQIIEELEREPRGIYGGAIGYMDFSGNMDVCIAIRMAVRKNGRVYVQAGSGIVADSVPEKEYEESENKARAVIEAITAAGEVEM